MHDAEHTKSTRAVGMVTVELSAGFELNWFSARVVDRMNSERKACWEVDRRRVTVHMS